MNIKIPTHDSLSAALLSRAKHGSVIIGLDEIDLAQLGITQSTPAPAAFAAHGFATSGPAAHAPATAGFATADLTAHAPATANLATAHLTARDLATADFATAALTARAPATADFATAALTARAPATADFATAAATANAPMTADFATAALTARDIATADFVTVATTAHPPATAEFAATDPTTRDPVATHPTPCAAAYPTPEPPEHAQVLPNGVLLLSACGSAARCAEQLSARIPPEAADCALLCRLPANVQVDELSCISGLARRIAGCRMGVVTDSALSECEVTLYIPCRQSAV